MTGLPKNIPELQNDKTLTFLLRSCRIELPLLNRVTVQYSYSKTFASADKKISLPVLKRMTELTNGYSYAFQLLGWFVWNNSKANIDDGVINSCMDRYKELLYRNASAKIYEEVSQMDRRFMRTMAEYSDAVVPMKFISDTLSKKPDYVSTYKRRLIQDSIIQVQGYGNVEFALPPFKNYVIEFQL